MGAGKQAQGKEIGTGQRLFMVVQANALCLSQGDL